MKCLKCQTDIPVSARFCPGCGVETVGEADAKAPIEVTLEWLENIYKGLEYKTEVKGDKLSCLHDAKPNLYIEIKAGHKFLGISSSWRISKRPNFFNRSSLMDAINKANSLSYVVTFSAINNGDGGVTTSTFMWLGYRTSARDIAELTDIYAQQVESLFDQSGLRAFA